MMLYLALITMSVFVMSVIYSMQKKFEREERLRKEMHRKALKGWSEKL